jgi:hypothetical protein
MNLYYADGGKKVGPIDKAQLESLIKAKKINSRTLVWEPGMAHWEELGRFVRRRARSGASSASQKAPKDRRQVCAECGQTFSASDMIHLKDSWVCAGCKPTFLQKIKEGIPTYASYDSDKWGSLEKGINGQYDISISQILEEAWRLTKGSKGVIIGSTFLVWLISIGVQQLISIPLSLFIGAISFLPLSLGTSESTAIVAFIIAFAGIFFLGFLSMLVQIPFYAGLEMIGVKRAANRHISFRYVFSYFNRFFRLAAAWLLMTLLIFLGFLLLVIPGIYLSIAFFLSLQLVIDKKLGPWQALVTSLKGVNHKWFHVFLLFLILGLIMIVSMIPLGIGLIWTWPLFLIAKGIVYRNIFGVEPAT